MADKKEDAPAPKVSYSKNRMSRAVTFRQMISGALLGPCRREHHKLLDQYSSSGLDSSQTTEMMACMNKFLNYIQNWAAFETKEGEIFWYDTMNHSAQWEKPKEILDSLDAMKKRAETDYVNMYAGLPPHATCEFLSARYWACNLETRTPCRPELADLAQCFRVREHPKFKR